MRFYAVGPDDVRASFLNSGTQLWDDIPIESAAFHDNIEWRPNISDRTGKTIVTPAPIERQDR
jgi:hypothetical protein